MYAQDGGSGEFIDPATADSSASGISPTNMFGANPLYINESLVAGESAGIPGFQSTFGSISSPAPMASVSPSWWDTIKNEATSAFGATEDDIKTVYGGLKDVTKTVYGDASSAVGTVFNDVTSPVKDAANATYWYTILAVIVVGGVLYFMGKSGVLKVNAVV